MQNNWVAIKKYQIELKKHHKSKIFQNNQELKNDLKLDINFFFLFCLFLSSNFSITNSKNKLMINQLNTFRPLQYFQYIFKQSSTYLKFKRLNQTLNNRLRN